MREKYTFSRALHLMRYSGEKMRYESYGAGMFLYFEPLAGCVMLQLQSGKSVVAQLDGFELVGSFTRYVPELDGGL